MDRGTCLFNDDLQQAGAVPHDGPAGCPQLQKQFQSELYELVGITEEMVKARMTAIRDDEGVNVTMSPDEYLDQVFEPEDVPQDEPRPILVRLILPTPEGTDKMQTMSDTDQEPGQAVAAPAAVKFALIGMEKLGPMARRRFWTCRRPPKRS